MKIILLQDIARLGKRGEVKDVADGYAINVLIAKKQALQATPGELATWKQKEEAKKHKKELETNIFAQLIEKIRKEPIVLSGKKRDDKGQLFAQVKEGEIADIIFEMTHISIDPKQIVLLKPIKSVGLHTIGLKQAGKKETVVLEIR